VPGKVVLSGYFGGRNFGDEAMLEYLVQMLRLHGVDDICALSLSPEETRQKHRVSSASQHSIRQKVMALKGASLLVFGGGELVKSYWPDGGRVVGRALVDVVLATAMGVPVVVLGVGAEELPNPVGRKWARNILSLAQAVWARDSTSLQRLAAVGIPQGRLKQGADLLFGVDHVGNKGQRSGESGETIRVGLSLPDAELRQALVDAPDRYRSFFQHLSQGMQEFLPSAKGNLVLLGFESNELADDLDLLHQLASSSQLSSQVESVRLAEESIQSALGVFKELDFLVGMRFHSVVFSALAGVPFLALSLEDKVKKLAADLDVLDWCFDVATEPPEALPERLRRAWDTRADLLERLETGRERLHQAALSGEQDLIATLTRQPRVSLRSRVQSVRLLAPLALQAALRRVSGQRPPSRPWATLRWASTCDSKTLLPQGGTHSPVSLVQR
jgi:polysaccharide pyruvyl transferase WcaK-like protein